MIKITNKLNLQSNLKKTAIVGGVIVAGCALSNSAFAAAGGLDIKSAVDAMMTPIISMVRDHWVKAIAISGIGSAILGEGDMRQRAIRAAGGVLIASGVVLAMLSMIPAA